MPTTDRYYDDKIDILELNGLSASQAFTLLPEQQPPLDMMAFLRLMQLSGGGTQGAVRGPPHVHNVRSHVLIR